MITNPNLTSYCGIYCPKCYKMRVSQAAAVLKDELERAKDRCGAKNFLTPAFQKSLADLIALHCPKVCKQGGGNPDCVIRKCCIEKKYDGCWKCGKFEKCGKLKKEYVENIKKSKKTLN